MAGNFGVWAVDADGSAWMHCPLRGSIIRGSRRRMRLYAADMAIICRARLIKARFSARRLPVPEGE